MCIRDSRRSAPNLDCDPCGSSVGCDLLRHTYGMSAPWPTAFFSWRAPERAAPPLLPLLEQWASTILQAAAWSIILRRTALGCLFHPSTYVSSVRTRLRKSEGEIPSTRAIDTDSAGPGRYSPLLARYKASTSGFSRKHFSRAELPPGEFPLLPSRAPSGRQQCCNLRAA